jgi:hypothetical protein
VLNAQEAPGLHDDPLEIKVAVIGPGNQLYFWWGHHAIIIENKITGESNFYDWGVFSFDNENFFINFAFGRLIYSTGVSPLRWNIRHYVETNRDIIIYTLDLPPEKKEEVRRFAEWSVLPENRDYYYHHFNDNCATRIRDIIDMAVDGQFKEKFGAMPGRFTLRQHVRRHTWFNPFFDWLLNFLMGQGIDRQITVWDEMFLPSQIGMRISDFYYTAPDGTERKLVSSVETMNKAENRPIVLDKPRLQWPRQLIGSLIASALMVLAFIFFGKKPVYRKIFGIKNIILGTFFGIVGSMLFFMSFFTNHDYTYSNINIIFINPLFLAAIPLGIILAFSKNIKKRTITSCILPIFWLHVFLGAILSILVKFSPSFYQQNWVDLALILPVVITMFLISVRMYKKPT